MPLSQQNSTISIALCICNPRVDFLKKQLESLENQTVLPSEIVVGVESENEDALALLKEWSDKSEIPCKIIQNSKRLGVTQNYSNVLSKTTGDYVFLCDQDDVWMPKKIELSVQQVKKNEEGGTTPVLFHTDLELIDANGVVISHSFMAKQRIKGGVQNQLGLLMLHNNVTGCSAAMNRSLLDLALPIPENAIVHDWWIALVAAITGKTVFVETSLTQYRMHDSNTIGLRPLLSLDTTRRFLEPAHVGREFARVVQQNYALFDHFGDELPQETRHFIETLQTGGFPLLKAARQAGIKPQTWSRRIRFNIAALSKSYKKYLPALRKMPKTE